MKFGKAFGLNVTVLSTSISKKEEALTLLGADKFVVSSDQEQMKVDLHKSSYKDFLILWSWIYWKEKTHDNKSYKWHDMIFHISRPGPNSISISESWPLFKKLNHEQQYRTLSLFSLWFFNPDYRAFVALLTLQYWNCLPIFMDCCIDC